MTSPPAPLSPQQLDRILAFLPIFERPGYAFGAWDVPTGHLPSWSPAPEVSDFLDTIYDTRFLVALDWEAWSEEAHRYINGGASALAEADLLTLRKLMTAHLGADRFIEGTLADLLKTGHIPLVLRRLRQIRDGLPSDEFGA